MYQYRGFEPGPGRKPKKPWICTKVQSGKLAISACEVIVFKNIFPESGEEEMYKKIKMTINHQRIPGEYDRREAFFNDLKDIKKEFTKVLVQHVRLTRHEERYICRHMNPQIRDITRRKLIQAIEEAISRFLPLEIEIDGRFDECIRVSEERITLIVSSLILKRHNMFPSMLMV